MAEPLVTIVSLDKNKLSDETEFQEAYLTFTFNENVKAYSVRCVGTSPTSGKNVQWDDKYVATQSSRYNVSSASSLSVIEFSSFPTNTLISAEISYYELYQEGENKVNVYGQDLNGVWTSYDSGVS